MSLVAESIHRPAEAWPSGEPEAGRVLRLSHSRLTLDELVSGAWAALGAGAPAACLVCDTPIRRATPVGPARCGGCGTHLS
jgi:hypothetical protein